MKINFDIEKFADDNRKELCQQISQEWEKLDYFLFKNKDKKFKMVQFRVRKVKTKSGTISFNRRIYKYYNNKLKKWIYVSLLDNELKVKKSKRFYNDIYNHTINFLGDGKRYRDIKDTIPNTNISLMTISRWFKNINLNFHNHQEKIKVNDNETIYINIDDCFMNFNRKKKVTYKFRIISFNTGIDKSYTKKPKLLNKRMAILINQTGYLDKEKYVDFIWNKLKEFYDFENAKIVIGGDGALWIKNVAKWFGANYVLDRWHALKLLWYEFKPNQGRRVWKISKPNFIKYQKAKNYFLDGNYQQLINFLIETKVAKTTLAIFKTNKDGILNQNKKWNIGVSVESDVFHFVKSLKGNGSKIYNSQTYINMVNFKIAKYNNQTRI